MKSKKMIAVMLLVILALFLISCGKSNNETEMKIADTAIDMGKNYYTSLIQEYKEKFDGKITILSFKDPVVVKIEDLTEGFYDVSCRVDCLITKNSSESKIVDVYYRLRFFVEEDESLTIIKDFWGEPV